MKIPQALHRIGLTSDALHTLAITSVFGSISLWGRSAGRSDKEERARAERLAIFVGLWPPTLFLLGKILQDIEHPPAEQAQTAKRLEDESLAEALKV